MSSYFKWLKSPVNDVLKPGGADFLRSAPDSLFLGTALFAMLTQSFSLSIFVLAMAEFGLVFRLLASVISAVSPNTTGSVSDMCRPGLPSPYQISLIGNVLGEVAFPSGVTFFMSAAVAYTLASVLNFRKELKELGKTEPGWKLRLPLSLAFSILFLLVQVIYRIVYSCETVLSSLGSTVLGLFTGMVVYLLHVYLFGRDSVNFLGIPLLADRAANGRPLYVCAKNST